MELTMLLVRCGKASVVWWSATMLARHKSSIVVVGNAGYM